VKDEIRMTKAEWPRKPLGGLLDFLTSGSRGWAEYYREAGDVFLRIQNVGRNQMLLNDVAFVEAPDSAEAKRTLVQPGDVLLSITADLGRTGVVPETLGRAYINQHLAILRVKGIHPHFLSAFLASPEGQKQVMGRNKHAVKAGLNFEDIRSFQIPLPPLAEQRRIAEVLDRAEALRAKRRAALAELDSLTQSLFLDLFGDPRKKGSTGNTPTKPHLLGELIRIRTGRLDANAADEDGIHPFFTCAVEPLRINTPAFDCKAVLVAGNGDLNVKYFEGKFNAYQRTYVIESLNESVLVPRFLHAFLDLYVSELRKQAIGGVIKYIKLPYLTDAVVQLPLKEWQQEFARRVGAVEKLKAAQRTALAEQDALFATLQHRAFRGEL
jgi:restriction endonuclease S subunit